MVETLNSGEYVAFFNGARNKLKLLTANNVLAYRKLPKGSFYDLTCISGIVRAFHNPGTIDYDSILKEKLEALLAKRKGITSEAQI